MTAVHVEGARELSRALDAAARDLEHLDDAHAAVGQLLTDDAQAVAPRRAGTLAASIRPAIAKGQAVVTAGGPAVPYAGVIHYGWPARNIEPQPFLDEAVERNQERITIEYEKGIEKMLKRNGLK